MDRGWRVPYKGVVSKECCPSEDGRARTPIAHADKWIGGERPVTLVGINFNSKKRSIDIPVIDRA